jgi:hypothetical protein
MSTLQCRAHFQRGAAALTAAQTGTGRGHLLLLLLLLLVVVLLLPAAVLAQGPEPVGQHKSA